MRVALLLSGAVRNFEDTYHSIKYHLLDKFNNNIDVFIYGVENIDGSEKNKSLLEKMYNPKKIVVNTTSFYDSIDESLLNSSLSNPPSPKFWNNSIRALFNVKMVNDLKIDFENENNFEYDVIIRSRFDLFWVRSVSNSEIEKAINDEIIIPYDWAFRNNHPSGGPNSFGFSDFYCICNSKNMNIYSSIFDKTGDFPYNYHPESVIGYYLRDLKVFESTRHITIDYPIDSNPLGEFTYASKLTSIEERTRIGLIEYDFYSPKIWDTPQNRKRFDTF